MAEPAIAAAVGDRFDHVLIDEYQDTNRLQAEVLIRLKPDGRGVTVVGDDAQSIYSFRAAEIRNILDFPALFTPPARVITLEKNYRSTQAILDASNAVIAFAAERFTKDLTSDRPSTQKPALVTVRDGSGQVGYVVERVLEAREAGVPLKAQAVLFRAAHHSAELEIELARHNIPFVKFGGLRFLEAAHVKDVLSVLRCAENPRDRVAAFRVLQLLPGSARPPPGVCSTASAKGSSFVLRSAASARPQQLRRTGPLSPASWSASGLRNPIGRVISKLCASGTSRICTSRIWTDFMRMRRCAVPISFNSHRLRPGSRAGSGS